MEDASVSSLLTLSENISGNFPKGVVYCSQKELNMMDDMILSVNTLPETLFRLIKTDKVKVRETGGEIRIVPISGSPFTDEFLAVKHAAVAAERKMQDLYDFCGSGSDLEMTVDSFLAMTHDEKEINGE
jgi:hypothetical protein